MADFTMPALGADMQTGTVVQWLVEPGARVRPGDVVAVVETHKGAIDVEIFLDGVIEDLAPLGAELPVGAVLARVRAEPGAGVVLAQTAPEPALAAVTPGAPVTGARPCAEPEAPPNAATAAARASASPAARQRAQALGIEVSGLAGTGAGGAVTLADVERAAVAGEAAAATQAAAPPDRPAERGFDPARMRRAIAAAMGRAKREIPHYYLSQSIDLGRAAAWVDAYNTSRDPEQRLLMAALLLKACALALAEWPQFNGFWVDDGFRPGAGVHLGWAIALRGGGLVAPAIHGADRMALPALMAALRDLVQRARSGRLRSSELSDPTATVTSLGDRGAESVFGVIYPPQVAMIGFGRVASRPWVEDGRVLARPLVVASLAADHRASDGHLGGLLLAAIERALQRPEAL